MFHRIIKNFRLTLEIAFSIAVILVMLAFLSATAHGGVKPGSQLVEAGQCELVEAMFPGLMRAQGYDVRLVKSLDRDATLAFLQEYHNSPELVAQVVSTVAIWELKTAVGDVPAGSVFVTHLDPDGCLMNDVAVFGPGILDIGDRI